MTDSVFIEGLQVSATIGVLDWERQIQQKLILDIRLDSDIAKAAANDQVTDALDYADITERVIGWVAESEFQLLESLGEFLCQQLLANYPTEQVTLRIAKPGAVRQTRAVGIELTRTRNN